MLLALAALLLVSSCRSGPGHQTAESELAAYARALHAGTASADTAAVIASAELTGVEPAQLPAEGRAAARRHHERALAASDPHQALAHEEVAYALLEASCPACARERISILLHLARLHVRRGAAPGLALCAKRVGSLDVSSLDPRLLSDWPALRRLSALHELLGDYARATRIEREILDGKLQVLDAAHPQVAASRERIAELERLAAPPLLAPPDLTR